MITFYHAPFSCSLAVKAALTATGVNFETKTINFDKGEHQTDEFLKINPMGKVPAIVMGDTILTEGSAINLFLAEKYPEANLMPESGSLEKAAALKWLQLMYTTLHSAFARAFYPVRYGDNEQSVKLKAEQEIHRILALIDQQLAENTFIAGETFCLADLYLMTAIHWDSALQKSITVNYENIARFEKEMFNQTSVGHVFVEEYGKS